MNLSNSKPICAGEGELRFRRCAWAEWISQMSSEDRDQALTAINRVWKSLDPGSPHFADLDKADHVVQDLAERIQWLTKALRAGGDDSARPTPNARRESPFR
jgi:hypothetical protein